MWLCCQPTCMISTMTYANLLFSSKGIQELKNRVLVPVNTRRIQYNVWVVTRVQCVRRAITCAREIQPAFVLLLCRSDQVKFFKMLSNLRTPCFLKLKHGDIHTD
jgi:hypothetical protein